MPVVSHCICLDFVLLSAEEWHYLTLFFKRGSIKLNVSMSQLTQTTLRLSCDLLILGSGLFSLLKLFVSVEESYFL